MSRIYPGQLAFSPAGRAVVVTGSAFHQAAPFFFYNDRAPPELSPFPLRAALPISAAGLRARGGDPPATAPAGESRVCIAPPIGWGSEVRGTQVLAGWICSAADLRKGPQIVAF